MHVYIYICVYAYIHVVVYIYMYTQAYTHIHMYLFIISGSVFWTWNIMCKAFSPHGHTLAVVCIHTQKHTCCYACFHVCVAGWQNRSVKDVCVLFLCMCVGTRKCTRTGHNRIRCQWCVCVFVCARVHRQPAKLKWMSISGTLTLHLCECHMPYSHVTWLIHIKYALTLHLCECASLFVCVCARL